MGRISLYEQSKLPSAVSGYRTSAAPEVAALENVSQSLGQVVNTYVATQQAKKKEVAGIEAQNAFNDFRASYATTKAELDQQSKSSPSKGIDILAGKLERAKTDFSQRYGAGLSDDAKKSYDAMVAQFNEVEGANIPIWSAAAKHESIKRESLASLASSADLVGNADTADGFTKALPALDEGVESFHSAFGGDKKKLLDTHRKSSITQHIANRVSKDARSLLVDLESGAYKDVPEIQSQYHSIWKQTSIAAQEQKLNEEFTGNIKLTEMRDSIQKSISDGTFNRAQALAEYSFAPEGSDEKKALGSALNRPTAFGGLKPVPVAEKKIAGANLMSELANIGLKKNSSKLDRVVAYNALVDKADLMLQSGSIDTETYSAITRVGNSIGFTARRKMAKMNEKIEKDKTAFKNLHKNEDDPLEYVLYRGFDDIGKNPKIGDNLGAVRDKYMQQVVRAFATKGEDEYDQLEQKMKDPNFREQLYTSIARAVANKDGNLTGFDALNRAYSEATGTPYKTTYKAKDGKEHKILASLHASTYIEMTPEMLKSLDTKEK